MAWDEAKAWMSGTLNQKLYQDLLEDAATKPVRNARRRKIVHPDEMSWEIRGRACSSTCSTSR
jgi:hypothetical protein